MADNDLLKAINSDFHRRIKAEQNKAIRGFAERLKERTFDIVFYGEVVTASDIERLVEEMLEAAP